MSPTPFSLAGKTAAITGGASGIGLAIARRFAAHGAAIEILDLPSSALGEECDVGDPAAVEAAFARLLARRERLHILVNNAGIAHVGNALTTTPEEFARIQRVNVNGVAHCAQAALRHMTAHGGGVILNLASTVAVMAIHDRFAYATSKGAVLAMTYSIAKDFLAAGVRCNALLPGRIHTPFVDGFIAKNYPGREAEMFEKLSQTQPIGRMGEPDEVAAAALFLCSDEASFITGCGYPVDGGTLSLR
jgi:NAD(P)-dependent dehydrogenase (short-subunit alcohol dehydrogenase family)